MEDKLGAGLPRPGRPPIHSSIPPSIPLRSRNGAGFTIIEVLLAIGILAVSITAVLFLFAMGMRSHRRALDRTRAAMLAETVVSQVQADFRPAYPATAIANATHPDFPGFTYDVTFTPLYGGTSFYRASVLVRWGDPNAPPEPKNSETYETVLQRKSF
ncbi:MAG TPA: prepilin-type N-terminal cleavage/methylation domain-containing protein [Planctomycetota bacterium]|nr:prepilin-type N-terminal cleavage/methylation domain-containing protein [Planctomycetota bacterium]